METSTPKPVTYEFYRERIACIHRDDAKRYVSDLNNTYEQRGIPRAFRFAVEGLADERFGFGKPDPDWVSVLVFEAITFASETDAVLFRLTHGDTFINPRLVTDDGEGGQA